MTGTDPQELARRLGEVEQRLDRLERERAAAPSANTEAGAPGPEPGSLWAVDGLRRRLDGAGGVLLAGVVPLPTGEEYVWQYGRLSADVLEWTWADRSAGIAALGHPVRLRLLQLILRGTRSAAELQADEELGTTGQLYHHLRQLIAGGWLHQTARGHYAVPGSRVIPLLVILTALEQ